MFQNMNSVLSAFTRSRRKENRRASQKEEHMSHTGDEITKRYGGLRFGESQKDFHIRAKKIDKLEEQLQSNEVSESEIDSVMSELRRLKGILDPEWDYEPPEE